MNPAVPLLAYQRKYLQDKSRFKIAMFARQTGKTFTTTLEITDRVFESLTGARAPERWVMLSRGERQAREAFTEGVLRHAQAYQLGVESLESTFKGSEGSHTQLEARFPNGSRVIALPANPDTARGYSAHVFLDEFAIHQQSREIWGALFPLISAGYDIRVTSTPKGKSNKFYELWSTQKGSWSRHSCTIHEAVEQGLKRNIQELRENLGDEELWSQEFELQFVDEATAYFPWDLINGCEHTLAGIPELYRGGECSVGVDIARKKDRFVIQVLERVGDVWWHREQICEQGITFAAQDKLLAGVFDRYKVTSCRMDETGMGAKPVEDAMRRHGSAVLGVTFTPQSKMRMAKAGKRAFEDRTIRIGSGVDDLRNDLHMIKKEVHGETVRFVADGDQTGHADRAWALLLAIDGACSPREEFAYQALPVRSESTVRSNDDESWSQRFRRWFV